MTKKCCLVLVVMLFFIQGAVLNAAPQDIPKKAVKYVTKGDKALGKQKFEDALEYYEKAIKVAPTYALAYIGKFKVYMQQNKKADAEKVLVDASAKDPQAMELKKALLGFYFDEGKAAYKAQQFSKSNGYFEKILAIPGIKDMQPNHLTNVYFNCGMNYMRMKNLKKSNNFFEKFLAQPDINIFDKKIQIQITYQVGINYYGMKNSKKSVEYFLKLLEFTDLETQFPQYYTTAYYMVGLNSHLGKDHAKADEYLKKFLEIAAAATDPQIQNQVQQLLPLANFFLGTSKMEILQKEVAKVTGDKEVKDPVKATAELANKVPEIETYLKKAIELHPKLEPAYMHLGNYYYYANKVKESVATYNQLISLFPNSPDLPKYKEFMKSIQNPKDKKGKKK